MPKFYLTKDAGRPVVVDGKKFIFEPADFFEPSHRWWGIYSADGADAVLLDKAVAARAVLALDESEYNVYLAKKKTAKPSSNIVNLRHSHAPSSVANSGKPAQVVEETGPQVSSAVPIEDVLKPVTITAPPPAPRSRKSK